MSNMTTKPQLTLSEALKLAMSRITDLKGRSRRSEYWWTALVMGIAGWILGFIPLIGLFISIAISLFMIPLGIRRLHDSGHSGWWYIIAMIIGLVAGGNYFMKVFPIVEKYADSGNVEKMADKMLEVYSDPLVICSMLACLIIGIIMLVFLCQDSKPAPNKWGVSPKYGDSTEDDLQVVE